MYTDYSYVNPRKHYDNSKKISELIKREHITTYQAYTWFPAAQYDHRVNSYFNFAMNLSAITGYCNAYSYNLIGEFTDKISYELGEIDKLMEITGGENISYYINNSDIASTIIAYSFSYNINYIDWQFL